MSETAKNPTSDFGHVFGFWLLRLWLSVRAILAGVEKYAGTETSDEVVDIGGSPNEYGLTASGSEKVYGLDQYSGVPRALYDKFLDEPLVSEFALNLYDTALGPALILVGLGLLFGIATRLSLFAMGLIYISLTGGLILLKQDAGVAWLGIHIILVAFALMNVQHNRLAILKKC
ncbi:MAG: hypothetical protein AAGH99_01790 [Planctomycetota bacterium]